MDSATDVAEGAEPVVPQPVADEPPSPDPDGSGGPQPADRGARRCHGSSPLATLALRLLTAANGPTDWDSAQYAAAVGHFDVTHGQPQPPGYWLYVVAGRFVHQVSGLGTIHSLVLVAAVASAAAAGLTAVAGRDLGGPWVGAGRRSGGGHLPVRLVQRLDRRHLLLRHGGLLAADHPGLAGPSGQLARRRRGGRPRPARRVPAVDAPVVRPSGPHPGGGIDASVEPVGPDHRGRGRGNRCLAHPHVAEPARRLQCVGSGHPHRGHRCGPGHLGVRPCAAGANNLGTFAAYTVVALAPLALVALLAGLVLGLRGLGRTADSHDLSPGVPAVDDERDPAPLTDSSPDSGAGPGGESNARTPTPAPVPVGGGPGTSRGARS